MNGYFDIFGTPIPLNEIKDFRVVQKEYIYRPVFEEYTIVERSFFAQQFVKKYRYLTMAPYAAIINESDRRWIFAGKEGNFNEHLKAEILNDIRETIGEKFKLKAVKGKRYLCMNKTGRVFQTYLDEIPVLVQMEDNRIVEIDKDNPLFSLLGNSVVPVIDIVPALQIRANENFIFWGNGIQIDDIGDEYKRLMLEMTEHKNGGKQQAIEKKGFGVPKLPKFKLKKKEAEDDIDYRQ